MEDNGVFLGSKRNLKVDMSGGEMDKFTPRAQQVIALARKAAGQLKCEAIDTGHLLLGLIELGQGVAFEVMRKKRLNMGDLRAEIRKPVCVHKESEFGGETESTQAGFASPGESQAFLPASQGMPFTKSAYKALKAAIKETERLNHSYVGTEHILLGLLHVENGVAAKALMNRNVVIEKLREEILTELGGDNSSSSVDDFGCDLTALAKEDKLDPVIGRAEEIERVIEVLCRRSKNNPLLIGEAGVGKTAIVEGLAQAIVMGNTPESLRNCRVVSLDIGRLVAGTQYRGQFEERLKGVLREIQKDKDLIIFIDELHSMVGTGAPSDNAMDASNIMKPALSRREIQCIGATTVDEYRKYIESDPALDRRFQSITIDAPSIDDTVEMLKVLRNKFEEHHNVHISDKSIEAAAQLSERFIPARNLPDKAVDIMDEAAAMVAIRTMDHPEKKEMETKFKALREEKQQAIDEQDFEKAAALRDREREARRELEQLVTEWKTKRENPSEETHFSVVEEDIKQIVSQWTGIPLHRMEEDEVKQLLSLEHQLSKIVVGQERVINALCGTLRRARINTIGRKRPIGSYAFFGPPGVGKTLLAKAIATEFYGDSKALIQINMSEYMDHSSGWLLTGSPTGYVGSDQGGQLTEQVRQKPYSVVLFDELEKAHPDVLNLLLQVLEEGRMTDGLGTEVDFSNTIVLMTSNLGSEKIRSGATIGFGAGQGRINYDDMREMVLEEARRKLRAEFLNRLDELLVFNPLTKTDMMKIMEIEVGKIQERLDGRRIRLNLDEQAKEFLFEKGYDPEQGARLMRRAVERHLTDPMADGILEGRICKGATLKVSTRGDEIAFKA